VWIGFTWPSIDNGGGFCQHGDETSGVIKSGDFFTSCTACCLFVAWLLVAVRIDARCFES
jgi:hypothetical protein